MKRCTKQEHAYDGKSVVPSGKYELCICGQLYRYVSDPTPSPATSAVEKSPPSLPRTSDPEPNGR